MMKSKITYEGQSGFWNARFKMLEQNLSPENAQKFRIMGLERKKAVVGKMIERGAMI